MELEEVVLGAMMLEKKATVLGLATLNADMFYSEDHRFIFEGIASCMNRHKACDFLLVSQELFRIDGEKAKEMNAAYRVTQLSSGVASVGHLQQHIQVIKEKYMLRELICRGSELIEKAYEESSDVELMLADMHKLIGFMMQQMYAQERTLSMREVMQQVLDNYYRRAEQVKNKTVMGIPTGLRKLDILLGGWEESTLNIIAARPGMGKTAFILFLSLMAVRSNKKALILSLEMDATQLGGRILQGQSGVAHNRFKLGYVDEIGVQLMEETAEELVPLPLFINDNPLQSIAKIRNLALSMKNQGGLDILFIDYLQLIDMRQTNRNYNREQEVAATTRELKVLAKELKIPVVLLSQLNRSNEKRDSKRPLLSDLRDSGAIEQDADTVLILHRPHYYSKDDADKGKLLIDLQKNRNGETAEFWLTHNDTLTDFSENPQVAKQT
ncbi:MAG: replicative DNA helicase [Bacteroidales bacterium]